MIYFARDTATDAVKIGTSTMVKARLQAISNDCGSPVELIASARGNRYHEAALHAEVWGLHIGREWFRADRRLDRLAKSVAAGTYRFPDCLLSVVSPLRREAAHRAHATRRSRLATARERAA